MMIREFFVIFILLLVSCLATAQDIEKTFQIYFNEVRSGKHPSIPKQLTLAENTKATLSSLPLFLRDTIAIVRAKAYTIAKIAGANARQPSFREKAVTMIIEGCKDHDSGNVGIALSYLTSFRKEEFTMAAKDTVVNLFKRKTAHYDKLIKLIGFLELKQVQNNLRIVSGESTTSKKDRWAAMLALARMGDNQSTENILSRVRKMTVNDDVVYQLFPDLLYTRQREAIDLLIEALNSDVENCMSADAEHDAKIPCGYRVMEMLAPVIEDYPLAVDESGDIDTKDYVSALKTVREWFITHPDYRINNDRF